MLGIKDEVTNMSNVELTSKYDIGEFVNYKDEDSEILCIVAEIHFSCNKVFYTLKNYAIGVTLGRVDSVYIKMVNDADARIENSLKQDWREKLLEEYDPY